MDYQIVYQSPELAAWLKSVLIPLAESREPDLIIGDDYLRRWFITPRSEDGSHGAVYLHNVRGPDDGRANHDHPWPSLSIVLSGGMREYLTGQDPVDLKAGDVVYRSATLTHRLDEPEPDTWTMFNTSATVRQWGFDCPKGWIPHTKFKEQEGCGE